MGGGGESKPSELVKASCMRDMMILGGRQEAKFYHQSYYKFNVSIFKAHTELMKILLTWMLAVSDLLERNREEKIIQKEA